MEGKLIDTIYGRSSKFEITKKDGLFSATSFWVYKDGKYWKSFPTLSAAAEAAKNA